MTFIRIWIEKWGAHAPPSAVKITHLSDLVMQDHLVTMVTLSMSACVQRFSQTLQAEGISNRGVPHTELKWRVDKLICHKLIFVQFTLFTATVSRICHGFAWRLLGSVRFWWAFCNFPILTLIDKSKNYFYQFIMKISVVLVVVCFVCFVFLP